MCCEKYLSVSRYQRTLHIPAYRQKKKNLKVNYEEKQTAPSHLQPLATPSHGNQMRSISGIALRGENPAVRVYSEEEDFGATRAETHLASCFDTLTN